jgi:hypothetical protein
VQTDGRTFLLRIGDDHIRVSSDRVTPAPTPEGEEPHAGDRRCVNGVVQRGNRPEELSQRNDWPQGASVRNEDDTRNEEHLSGNPPEGDKPEADEFVLEKIVRTKMSKDGTILYRIRWFGYSHEDDTWEPREHLPISAVRRYHRRVGLPIPE